MLEGKAQPLMKALYDLCVFLGQHLIECFLKVTKCCSVELDSSRPLLAIDKANADTLRLAVDECLIKYNASRLLLAAFYCLVHDGETKVLNVTDDTLHNVLPFQGMLFVENESPSLILNIYIISNFYQKVKNFFSA